MDEELSQEELEKFSGGGFWDKLKEFAEKAYDGISDSIKDVFD